MTLPASVKRGVNSTTRSSSSPALQSQSRSRYPITWPWAFFRVSLPRGLYSSSEQPLATRLTASRIIVLANLIAVPFRARHSGLFLIRTALYAGFSAGAKVGLPNNTKVLFQLREVSPDGFYERTGGWHPGH